MEVAGGQQRGGRVEKGVHSDALLMFFLLVVFRLREDINYDLFTFQLTQTNIPGKWAAC